jgi:hypothetical protein
MSSTPLALNFSKSATYLQAHAASWFFADTPQSASHNAPGEMALVAARRERARNAEDDRLLALQKLCGIAQVNA